MNGATGYSPVNCEFHDVLEHHATTRARVCVRFRDEAGALWQRDAVITDVFARGGADYLSLDTGETVRLDRIVEVDGLGLAEFPTVD
jgi:Rho-binding antiterminator